MNRVAVAVIGLGYWGPNMLRNFAQSKEMDLIAACDAKQERLDLFKGTYPSVTFTTRVDDLWNDPRIEAVAIATPLSTHEALVTAALNAGKHVLVEKPLAPTLASATALVDLAKAKGKLLLIDHTFVYENAVERIKQYADDGSLGSLLYYDSTRINLGLIQRDTNVLWDLAVHDLAILNHIRPMTDLASVMAWGHKHHTNQVEMAHLHLSFADGFAAHVAVSWLSPVKIRRTLVGGSDKMIVYDDNEPADKIRLYDKGVSVAKEDQSFALPVYRTGDVLIPRITPAEPLRSLSTHFARCIRGEEEPRSPGTNSLRIIEILELADRSLAEGRTVSRV